MTKIELDVTGMTCGHCQTAVTNTLKSVPGVDDVQVNLQTGKAVVQGAAQPEQLIAAVQEEGYGARLSTP
ncbi:CopZ family metallochaperone [Deinococcus multiflagellatus]|uniref:Heavy-metal-associated domain-containing protein n=1 Tax=Deinococcus multiflagellatus TaxID=1656887 RepID=A0ABW1ZJU4_9DEIO|nr:heavy metal-associated domain-containing protein [Deinococcus multiflagellatus]MBZ9711738.1 heavy-metal-associated domain-containing protein [Deinococcus multiflagellatus]